MTLGNPQLQTERLVLALLQSGMEQALRAFLFDNRAHFAPWDPPLPQDAFEPERLHAQIARAEREFANGTAVRLMLFPHDDPARIIGSISFSHISRGAFQAAFLGYKIAREHEGKGLMREALQAAIGFLFDDRRLHRIHANYIPDNVRSGKLLAHMGFTIEGYAKDYLFINGAWRDHVLTSLTNAQFDVAWLMPDMTSKVDLT